KTRNCAQKRGLATARGAKQRKEFARANGQVDPPQRMIIAIMFLHPPAFDHRLRAGYGGAMGGGAFRGGHRKPPVSLAPVRAIPRRRKYSAMVSNTTDKSTRTVPRAMIAGICLGNRSWLKI